MESKEYFLRLVSETRAVKLLYVRDFLSGSHIDTMSKEEIEQLAGKFNEQYRES